MRFVLLLLLCFMPFSAQAENFLDKLPSFGIHRQPDFLPPDKAFVLNVKASDDRTLAANFDITPSYYLYKSKISFTVDGDSTKIAAVNLPQGEVKTDPNLGKVEVYHHPFVASIVLDRTGSSQPITLHASYQG